jgi:hypothetical protein
MAFKNKEEERAYQKAYYETHRDQARERSRKWRAANPDQAREQTRKSSRKWRAANPDQARELALKWYYANLDQAREHSRKWRHANLDQARESGYRSKHGLTTDEVSELRKGQEDKCALCGNTFVDTPHIDHNHECCPPNKSCPDCRRELLCGTCNRGLGMFKDSPALLQRAIDYLVKHARRQAILKSEDSDVS